MWFVGVAKMQLMRFFLAAALADLGKLKEAKAEADAGLRLDPTFTFAVLNSPPRAIILPT